ncbi:MAG: acetoacetate--CoA ligase [Polyangiales bacterium]
MAPLQRGTVLHTPTPDAAAGSALGAYARWLAQQHILQVAPGEAGYEALWQWSVREPEAFWESILQHFGVRLHAPYRQVLSSRTMPGGHWFAGAQLNYAEHLLRRRGDGPAIVWLRDDGSRGVISWDGLREAVARARTGLARHGVVAGDRVAAYLPNGPEAVIALLATASLGAIWSSCSPEFGVQSVLDRLTQLAPKVLFTVDGYGWGEKRFERLDSARAIARALPSLETVVVVPRLGLPHADLGPSWDALCAVSAPLKFAPVPFEHPLWVLYSSGTTGLPKAIVQGHGGILLEHLKALALHGDVGPDSRFFWFTTTGWMMWNYLVSGLAVGATIVLYEGDPLYPDDAALFRHAARERVTDFGTSAPFVTHCEKRGVVPRAHGDFGALRAVGVTGAPLPVSGFGWLHDQLGPGIAIGSISGGTDLCTAFLTACPWLPVRAGELQCRALGAKVEAFDPDGAPCIGEVGELVITLPMPSMPTGFLHDPDGQRLRASYFDTYPGVWRHGDFIEITPRGGAVIYGRSDATLNRGGVRMGTAELYRIVDASSDVRDSLVVDTSALDREGELWLFVVLEEGKTLSSAVVDRLRGALRTQLSPRHVPDHVLAVAEVPRTLNGKKLEVPIKRILMGTPRDAAIQPGTLQNPGAVDAVLEACERVKTRP